MKNRNISMPKKQILGLALLVATACVPGSTDTSEVGVKYCKFWCGDAKYEIIPPGQTIFYVPIKNDWYTLNLEMQSFYMTMDENTGDRGRRDDLVFKTKEGNNIGQDVVLTWKLDHTKAVHIIEKVGSDIETIKEKYLRPLARSIVRDHFNRLRSNEFYESQRRFEEAQKATDELKTRFQKYGIIIDRVNPQDYRFEDKRFQNAINDAKEAGQDLEKYKLEKSSQEQFWKKKLQEQIGQSNETIAAAQGEKASRAHQANATFAEYENEAQAIVAEKAAEAKAILQLRQAMASRGGETAVKMEYAKNFNPKEILVLPCDESRGTGVTIKRLDLNSLIQAEVVRQSTDKASDKRDR